MFLLLVLHAFVFASGHAYEHYRFAVISLPDNVRHLLHLEAAFEAQG
jgi:hypothetical protein